MNYIYITQNGKTALPAYGASPIPPTCPLPPYIPLPHT